MLCFAMWMDAVHDDLLAQVPHTSPPHTHTIMNPIITPLQVLLRTNFDDFPSTALTLEFWMWSVDACRPGGTPIGWMNLAAHVCAWLQPRGCCMCATLYVFGWWPACCCAVVRGDG